MVDTMAEVAALFRGANRTSSYVTQATVPGHGRLPDTGAGYARRVHCECGRSFLDPRDWLMHVKLERQEALHVL